MIIRNIKFTFILLAVGLTFLLFNWPNSNDKLKLSTKLDVDKASKDLSTTKLDNLASTVMEAPNFSGQDENNNHWRLKAKRAIQDYLENDDIIKLESVDAWLNSSTGREFKFKAGEGSFIAAKHNLSLSDNVLVEGYGYTLETNGIDGNINNMKFTSNAPIKINGLKGSLNAGKFLLEGKDNKLLFSNGVRIKLYLKRTEKSYAESKINEN